MKNNYLHNSSLLKDSLQNLNRGAGLLVCLYSVHNNTTNCQIWHELGLKALCYKLPASLGMSLQHAILMVASK